MADPKDGDKVIVYYDDGSYVIGTYTEQKPCWEYLQAENGHVYIITERAICITKVEDADQ